MFKKMAFFVMSAFLLTSLYGCATILVAGAGGAGTAFWLSGKLTETVNASFDRTIKGTKEALQSLNLPINKDTKKTSVAQIMTTYTDGSETWIDIRPVTKSTTQVSVRVGMRGDKAASSKILEAIKSHLGPF